MPRDVITLFCKSLGKGKNAYKKGLYNMKLTDIGTIKELLGEEDTSFKKKFGQNFLINESVVRRIALECLPNGAESGKKCGILEIGPGIGTLTAKLCKAAKCVVCVEIDSTLIPLLNRTLAEFDNVKIISGDIMKLDLMSLIKESFFDCEYVAVAANLPYYITTPVIMKLLEAELPLSSITVMVQKEVADRLCSDSADRTYGAVTASVSFYAQVRKLFNVGAGNFIPAPKVDSAVIRFDLYKNPPFFVSDKALFFKVIKAAFAQRRKTLVNALSGGFSISKADAVRLVKECGFDEMIRGEALSPADFANIANRLSELQAVKQKNNKLL